MDNSKTFLVYFSFESIFRITAKLIGRHKDFLYTLPPHMHKLLHLNIPHQSGSLVTIHEPILIHHFHPNSIVCVRIHSCCCRFYGLWQMTCIHPYSIQQSSFIALKIPCAPPVHPSRPPYPPPITTALFIVFICSFYCLFQNVK